MDPPATALQQQAVVEAPEVEDSDVAAFYRGRRVFVTGASGFMGKVLVEKLLRACPDVGDILVLLRPKKGLDVHARLRQMLAVPVFDALRRQRPATLDKVKAVAGDAELPELGLAPADRALITDTVSVVFHVAATVRFDAHLREAAAINVAATETVLKMCRDMPGLAALVHVSTAYCACLRSVVREAVLPAPMSARRLREELAARDDAAVLADTPKLIGRYPNTYTFTKAIAEAVVLEEAKDLPVVIVRPSIVTPSWREPLAGWVDNLNGPVGPWVAIGKGMLSCVYGRADMVADLVPVDVCIDMLVAAAWGAHARPATRGVTVYNCVTGPCNPLKWGDVTSLLVRSLERRPFATSLGTPAVSYTTSRVGHRVRTAAGQVARAHVLDALASVTGLKSPRLADQVQKLIARMKPLEFFTTHEFDFETDNSLALWSMMSAADRRRFPFADVADMDWGQYMDVVVEGAKVHLLHEDTSGPVRSTARARFLRAYSTERLLSFLVIPLLYVAATPLMSKL